MLIGYFHVVVLQERKLNRREFKVEYIDVVRVDAGVMILSQKALAPKLYFFTCKPLLLVYKKKKCLKPISHIAGTFNQ